MVASALFAVAAVLAGVPAAYAEQLYSKDTPVMQINGRDAMNQLINKSNRTSVRLVVPSTNPCPSSLLPTLTYHYFPLL